jgi:pilus assembly protein FimV
MKRLTTSIAIAGLLTPLATHALGVGEIRLQSYLNQTLRAEIPLVLSRESLEDLRIQLASPRDFATAGLERPTILTKLRFRPERKADGGFVIRVASTEAIREPYLNFLVELAWPEGRMLKTFTVLLDPPDVLAATRYPEPMNAPIIDGNPDRPAFGAPAAAAHQPSPGDGPDYGPVGRNEKLWTIAQHVNPDPSAITTEQVVVALFRYNPEAFSRPSVNALNAGAMLRIPSLPYIQELSPATAREEFYRQQRGRPARWLSDAPTREAAAERMPENPVTGYRAPAPVPQAAAATPATLGDTSLKAVEALQRENAEMRKRLAELEKRVADLQVLFAERELLAANGQPQAQLSGAPVKEADAARTSNLNAAPPAPAAMGNRTSDPAQPAGQTPPAAAPTAPAASPQTFAEATPAASPTIVAPKPHAPVSAAPQGTGQDARATPTEASVTPWIFAAAGAAIAAVGGLFFWRRRRNHKSANGVLETTSPVAPGETPEAIASPSDPPRMEADEVDPVFEADVYASYGRLEQALETIESALHRHPEREAYELKLLELLACQGNGDRFQQETNRIKSQARFNSAEFWGKVETIAQRLPPVETAPGAAAPPSPAPPAHDDTDRLIDQIKQFSLRVRGDEASLPSEPPPEIDAGTTHPGAAESLDHGIPWVPVEKSTSDSPEGPTTGPTAPSFAALDDPDHSIDFSSNPVHETRSTDTGPENKDFEDLASESIDTLLKELSALHFERHFQEEHPGSPDNGAPDHDGERSLSVSPVRSSNGTGIGDPAQAPEDPGPADSPQQATTTDLETKLDLARAYSDMGDYQQARQFLQEVMSHGSPSQRAEAEALLAALAHH